MAQNSNNNSLREGTKVHVRTVGALVVREMMVRWGRDNIGFAWVILEPMLLSSGVMVIWSLTGINKHAGMNLLELVLTGYLPLTLWRHLTNNSMRLFRNSAALLYHRSITLFDIVFAKVILESLGATLAFLTIWSILSATGLIDPPERIDLMIAGWLSMAWLGSATGALIAVMTELWEAGERIIQPLQYVIIPISGAFIMVDWIPYEEAQQLLLLNPTVHCYEMFRAGFWGDRVVTHYSVEYVSTCSFLMTFLAFILLVWVRPRVQLT